MEVKDAAEKFVFDCVWCNSVDFFVFVLFWSSNHELGLVKLYPVIYYEVISFLLTNENFLAFGCYTRQGKSPDQFRIAIPKIPAYFTVCDCSERRIF